jgi:hypothetical protein
MVNIQVSVGELIDKLSILQIKLSKITDEYKLNLINHEFALLHNEAIFYLENHEMSSLYSSLLNINFKLWDVEDRLRILEKENRFEGEFIDLARKVYYLNDERFEIKNQINTITSSEIVEVKEYIKYK